MKFWGIEFGLLFSAFFIPFLYMYFTRWQPIGQSIGDTIKTIGITFLILFILVLCKHIGFQYSGLYAFKFGSGKCKKHETEHFDSNETVPSASHETVPSASHETDPNLKDMCECENSGIDSTFNGPFWRGLKKYGMGLTGLIFIYLLVSLVKPEWTYHFFNYNFNRYVNGGILLFTIGIFLAGFFSKNILNTNADKCRKQWNDNEILGRVQDGCAFVSCAFIAFTTLLPAIILFMWFIGVRFDTAWFSGVRFDTGNLDTSNVKGDYVNLENYTCGYFRKGGMGLRFFIWAIETLLMYLVFCLAEAGIESSRKDENIIEILKSKTFWVNSLSSLLGVIFIQILLEYSRWYEFHLFKKENPISCPQ